MTTPEDGPVAELLELWQSGSTYEHSFDDLLPLHLRALDQRLTERRGQIRVLDQRAKDQGISSVDSLGDVVPLLFAHMTYKSYPERLVINGDWALMNAWLGTLATRPVERLDLDGIVDVDDWLGRLDEEGHHVRASSGTQGKASFLNWSDVDQQHALHSNAEMVCRGLGIDAEPVYPMFILASSIGFRTYIDTYHAMMGTFGRPDARYFLSDVPERVSDVNRIGAIRKAMIDGTASPTDVQELEAASARQTAEMGDAMDRLVEQILRHYGETVVIRGAWAQLYRLMEAASARGVGEGELCVDSYVLTAGGRKAVSIPGDYESDVRRFFTGSKLVNNFGMSEFGGGGACPECSEGRWHFPLTIVPVLLDESGEALVPRDGPTQEGRLGAFDLTLDGRWGGVISSDKVTMHYDRCPCGTRSASLSSVGRYSAQGDDKLTCAGQIEAYVRGIIDT